MLIQISKKIYVIFLILLSSMFGYFLKEVQSFNEKSDLYARQNLFHARVDFNEQNKYFLDGYNIFLDFQNIPYCDLIQNYPVQKFKQMAYRYPSASTISNYWLLSQKYLPMREDAKKVHFSYVLLTKSGKHTFKNQQCHYK